MYTLRVFRAFVVSLFLFAVVHATIFFESDFECGQTYAAHELKPGQRSIEVCPTYELEHWPATGGKGIVEYNWPQATDTFTYRSREDRILKGVRGLQKSHPRWADVRTGGFWEWSTGKGTTPHEARGKVFIESQNPVAGAHSAGFDYNAKAIAILVQPYSETEQDSAYCRFLVRFSPELLTGGPNAIPFAYWTCKQLSSPKLVPQRQPDGPDVTLGFAPPSSGKILSVRSPDRPNTIVADKSYCIEMEFRRIGTDRLVTRLWIDGTMAGEVISQHELHSLGWNSLAIGKASESTKNGIIQFDEILISDQRLGPIPPRPRIAFRQGRLVSLGKEAESLAATQWQASENNTWLLPLLNTGPDPKHLLILPHTNILLLPDSLNPFFVFDQPFSLPVSAKPGQSCLARVRHRSKEGSWSAWSRPCAFTMPETTPLPGKKKPVLHAAWFSRPGQESRLKTIRKGTWYDLHLRYDALFPDKVNSGFVDVFWTSDLEGSDAHYANRGGEFRSQSSYFISFSLGAPSVFPKQIEGSRSYTELYGTRGLYSDATQKGFSQNPQMGRAAVRVRLLEQANEGTWRLSAYLKEKDGPVSPIYQNIFFVSSQEALWKNKGSFRREWIVLIVLFAVLVLLVYHFARKRKASRSEAPESDVNLSFDSPYDERIKTAQEYILANFTNPVSPKDVAQAIGVSPNWLSKFFKRGTGKTVIEYLIELRIQEVKRLLKETKLDVSHVAMQSGFVSMTHFRQCFREIAGMPPGEYRKSVQ